MLSPDNVFIAIKPVDMRRGIDSLTQYIQDELRSTWHEGAAFVFVNKARSRIKVLRWDKHGGVVVYPPSAQRQLPLATCK
ncbi:IS66 Orf2 like protein [Shigella sonnei]|nr:IS66 Orf2 like protein [Shigella sonnei]SJG83360.1 IS66 Orf2 like protein [Shigella sonnei]